MKEGQGETQEIPESDEESRAEYTADQEEVERKPSGEVASDGEGEKTPVAVNKITQSHPAKEQEFAKQLREHEDGKKAISIPRADVPQSSVPTLIRSPPTRVASSKDIHNPASLHQ